MFEIIAGVLGVGAMFYMLLFPYRVEDHIKEIPLTPREQKIQKICLRHAIANAKFNLIHIRCEITNGKTTWKIGSPHTVFPFQIIHADSWRNIAAYRRALGSVYYLYDNPIEVVTDVVGFRGRKGPEFHALYDTVGRPSPVMVRVTPSGKFYVGKLRCREVTRPKAVISCEEAKKIFSIYGANNKRI